MGRVLVVGSLNVDLIVRLDRRPAPGETVAGRSVERCPGGKGANQAVAAARCGAAVSLAGCVGADGDWLRNQVAATGVDVSGVTMVPETSTGLALITVTPDGENSIVVVPGANARVEPTSRISADVLLTVLEIPLASVEAACSSAALEGCRVVLTAAPARPLPSLLLGVCDPVLANVGEARTLLSVSSLDAALLAGGLVAAGARSAVVTAGVAGAFLADGDGVRSFPAAAVDVVDTTGAGDAFAGALAARLAGGATLDEAVAFAVGVGSAAVTVDGAWLPSQFVSGGN